MKLLSLIILAIGGVLGWVAAGHAAARLSPATFPPLMALAVGVLVGIIGRPALESARRGSRAGIPATRYPSTTTQ